MYLLMVALSVLLADTHADEPAGEQGSTAGSGAGVPGFRQANTVAVFRVEGPIDNVTLNSLERRLDEARYDGADAIVLDLHTPGGELNATLDICTMIKADFPPNTVAWVNRKAYSAGTIIALAAREIVVHPEATFGDAAPVTLVPLPTAERAKAESPVLAEVVDSARRNHYDEKLVQSFVSVGVELWMLENPDTGERIFVDQTEYERIFGEQPPDELTQTITPSDDGRTVTPMLQWLYDQSDVDPDEEIDPEELSRMVEEDVEAAQRLPSVRPQLGPDDRGDWQLLGQVVNDQRLLTVKPDEAIHYGLAQQTIENEEELKAYFGATDVRYYDESFSESLIRLLMSWPVQVILIATFLIGIFVELASPGLGLFGGVALAALLLLVGAPALLGMANWLAVLLLLGGVVLIGIELFVIPGVGLAGIIGVLCMFLGMVGIFLGSNPGQSTPSEIWSGVAGAMTALFAAGIAVWLIARHVETLPIFRRVILSTELKSEYDGEPALAGAGRTGETSAPDATSAGATALGAPNEGLQPGDVGVAHTDLYPTGRAMFDERIIDVQAEAGYIRSGTPIRVTTVGRFVIKVEEDDQ